jgi:hypothetical protein
MKTWFFLIFGFIPMIVFSQSQSPKINVRFSILVAPFTPLITVEAGIVSNLTLQGETNFVNTHGLNLKYFLQNRMEKSYVFVGNAWVVSDFLRKDKQSTLLPYVGYGYAHRWGNKNQWTFDSRLGLGRTINADNNSIYPVLKTGIGRVF